MNIKLYIPNQHKSSCTNYRVHFVVSLNKVISEINKTITNKKGKYEFFKIESFKTRDSLNKFLVKNNLTSSINQGYHYFIKHTNK